MNIITPVNLVKADTARTLKPRPGDTPLSAYNGKMRTFTLVVPVTDLLSGAFPRNTHQRNEQLRNAKHLDVVMPEHLNFACLQGFNDERALIDGHTRIMMWIQMMVANMGAVPPLVRITVYDIIDPTLDFDDEELRLYISHDSRNAVKTSAQTVQSALSATKTVLNTKWMAAGSFASALEYAGIVAYGHSFKKKSKVDQVTLFRDELLALDSIAPQQKKKFVAAFTCSALLLLKIHKRKSAMSVLKTFNTSPCVKAIKPENSKYFPAELLMEYRETGLSGDGTHATGYGALELGTMKILKYMHLMITDANAVFMKDDEKVSGFTSKEVADLVNSGFKRASKKP